MPLPVWLSLVFLLCATTFGAATVFLSGRAFWRDLKRFGVAVDGTVAAVTASVDRLGASTQSFGSGFPRLDASVGRLRVSTARLAVLRAAIHDVRDALGRLTAVYPRK